MEEKTKLEKENLKKVSGGGIWKIEKRDDRASLTMYMLVDNDVNLFLDKFKEKEDAEAFAKQIGVSSDLVLEEKPISSTGVQAPSKYKKALSPVFDQIELIANKSLPLISGGNIGKMSVDNERHKYLDAPKDYMLNDNFYYVMDDKNNIPPLAFADKQDAIKAAKKYGFSTDDTSPLEPLDYFEEIYRNNNSNIF